MRVRRLPALCSGRPCCPVLEPRLPLHLWAQAVRTLQGLACRTAFRGILAPLGGVERPRRKVRFVRLIDRRGRDLGVPSSRAASGGSLKPALVATQGGACNTKPCVSCLAPDRHRRVCARAPSRPLAGSPRAGAQGRIVTASVGVTMPTWGRLTTANTTNDVYRRPAGGRTISAGPHRERSTTWHASCP